MIYVDANVVMYLVGEAHPYQDAADAFVREYPDEHYVTSAAVYEEMLHYYCAIHERSAADDAFALLDALVQSAFPVTRTDVESAEVLANQHQALSSRQCQHLAIMQAHRVSAILTFDHGFAAFPGVICLPESAAGASR